MTTKLETIQKDFSKKRKAKDNECEIKIHIQNALRAENADISIYVFSLGTNRLNLFAEYFGKEKRIKIVDIQVDKQNRNKGYGSIALETLLEIGESLNTTEYSGFLSNDDINDVEDLEHKNRIIHFYTKFGFDVDIKHNRIRKYKLFTLKH